MNTKPDHDKELILLQGTIASNFGNRFFTTNVKGKDQTRLDTGEVAYTVLGYANTVAEAQMKLYGRVYN
jgi:hypothetical protein